MIAGMLFVGNSLFDVNIFDSKWQGLLKVAGAGFIIFLVYAIALGIVFRERPVKCFSYLKKIRK
jgi:hypothetical protein